MAEKKSIQTDKAAELGGPYSQAVVYKDLIFISGQGAIDPVTNEVRPGTVEEETGLALENIKIILAEAGSSLERVLQVRAFLTDIREYGRFNSVYQTYFTEPRPARTCLQAKKLPFGLRVEIDAIGFI
jgi:2-iminobutanoate/2-iminopropanoate deaminase